MRTVAGGRDGRTPAADATLEDAMAEPAMLLVYDGATSATTPHLAQTLVASRDNWLARSFTVAQPGGSVSMAVDGYSSASIPRSSPDVKATLTWAWRTTAYVETSTEPPHVTLPR